MAEEFSFKITDQHGILSESKGGWTMELNSVSWNGRDAKYDIRSWAPDHEKMGKGITLSRDELTALKKLLSSMDV